EFSPDLEAVLIVLSAHQVHGHVFDDGHILGAGTGSEAGEVVMEDDIEDPVKPVFDAPMGAYGSGEAFGIELSRGEIITSLLLEAPLSFDLGFDHRDHGEMRESWFVGIAPVGEQPIHLMAYDMTPALEAAMVLFDRFEGLGDL